VPQTAPERDEEERRSEKKENGVGDSDDAVTGRTRLTRLTVVVRVVIYGLAPHDDARDDQAETEQEREHT